MSRSARALLLVGLTLAFGDETPAQAPAQEPAPGQAAGKDSRGRRPAAKAEAGEPAEEGSAGRPSFARDVAPILVANCVRCHGGDTPRGDFNQGTFRGLIAGGKGGEVIVAGSPDDSRLIGRIKAEGPEPKMPPGNERLTPEAVAKIEAWVRAGARLDAGLSPTDPIARYAATPEQIRKAEIAKLSPAERDKRLEDAARERWAGADPDGEPEMTSGDHFALFGDLPEERAKGTLKTLEAQYGRLRGLLSRPDRPALDWGEKVSLYVFNDRSNYVEFVRTVENREVEAGDSSHANLSVESPYLAAVDPLGGKPEPAGSGRRSGRSRKSAADEAPGPERSLAGLLSEPLGAAALDQAGKPPRWLSLGLGAYLAMQVEPRSPYYSKLRARAFDQVRLGWEAKAAEALGGEADDDRVRAVGFAVVEFLATEWTPALSGIVQDLVAEGGEKLDDVLGRRLNANREQFLFASKMFVGNRYGRAR